MLPSCPAHHIRHPPSLQVEGVILEMYSSKKPSATKPQPLSASKAPPPGRRRSSDADNRAGQGRGARAAPGWS